MEPRLHKNLLTKKTMEFSEWLQQQYQPYFSSYLMQGWKQDRHLIKSIELEPGFITVYMDILDSYYPPETYYLSTIHAIPLLYQFVILYGCWDNQLAQKPGDVYLRSLHIETPRKIEQLKDICFTLKLVQKRNLKEWWFYGMDFTIGDTIVPQAFTGHLKYVVPHPQP